MNFVRNAWSTLAASFLVAAVAGCPQGNNLSQQSGLALSALGVTARDPALDRTSYKVYLTWNAVPGVQSYELDLISSTGPHVLKSSGDLNYTDTGLDAGATPSYYVRALDANNVEKIRSDTVAVPILADTVTGPTGLVPAGSVTSAQPTLSWTAVSGASGYYVTLSTTGTQGKVIFAAVTTTPSAKVGTLPNPKVVWPGYPQQGDGVSLTAGTAYRFDTFAIRTDNSDLAKALSIDVAEAAQQQFFGFQP